MRHYPLSPRQSLLLTHVFLALALVFLVLRYWRDIPRFVWAARLAPVLALLFFALTVAGNHEVRTAPRLAVALIEEAPVFFSMNELDPPRFLLYEGDRVLIDRFEGQWLRVHAYGGERGWMRRDDAGVVAHVAM